MTQEPFMQHVAVEYDEKHQADLFFGTILGLQKIKTMLLSKEMSHAIFGIDASVTIEMYGNDRARFEVFISSTRKKNLTYDHVCLEVPDKKEFMTRCQQHGLKPFSVEKDGRQLWFVRDFAGYLFEIK
jgi:catechol 2,3-dioxygenase-like lactoylglutathione lyase family enzyme